MLNPGDCFLSTGQVCGRFGVSQMTVWRWARDPRMDFPAPVLINKRKFYRLSDLLEFERRHQAQPINGAAQTPSPKIPETGWSTK